MNTIPTYLEAAELQDLIDALGAWREQQQAACDPEQFLVLSRRFVNLAGKLSEAWAILNETPSLVERCTAESVRPQDLDESVLDCAAHLASRTNNGGLAEQLVFLQAHGCEYAVARSANAAPDNNPDGEAGTWH